MKLARLKTMLRKRGAADHTSKYRGREVLNKLRLDHLSSAEREFLENTCLDYQDIFYMPGVKLSSRNAAQHSIEVEPGTAPTNTRPYRLLEAQNQVGKLLTKG
jgi:hypothetical protein